MGRDERLAPWPRTPEVVRQHLADYYAAITFLDAQVGRILEALKDTGQYENTIIVFTSDHGLAIGSHGLFGKQNIYDHSMHVPLIMAGPGIPQGRRRDAFVYLLDLVPHAGRDERSPGASQGSEGQNLVPVLEGKANGGARFALPWLPEPPALRAGRPFPAHRLPANQQDAAVRPAGRSA